MSYVLRRFVLGETPPPKRVYLDNAATTEIDRRALDAMVKCTLESWGNPSGSYAEGKEAKRSMEWARSAIAKGLGDVPPSCIHFTSCGTESNNIAIRATMLAQRKDGKNVLVTSSVEHSSVRNTADRCGCEHIEVRVDANGMLDLRALERVLVEKSGRVGLVSIILAQNEVGAVQDISTISGIVRRHGIPLHVDATQAIGKIQVNVNAVDMLTASSHKFHGPKGVGILYVRNGFNLVNSETTTMTGGGQEQGVRSGTENVPAIVGCAVAYMKACEKMSENFRTMAQLKRRLETGIKDVIPNVLFNSVEGSGLPNIINFCLPNGMHAHDAVKALDRMGVSVNSGSACTKMKSPSKTLLAMGRSSELAHSAIRVSISHRTTFAECDRFLSCLRAVISNPPPASS